MKSLYVLTALAAFNLVAAQKTIELKEFKNLTLGADMKVTLVKSTSNKLVTAGGGEDDDDELHIQNQGGSLTLSGTDDRVTLYYKDALENIIAGSDAELIGSDEIKSKNFNLTADSDAKIELKINVQKLQTNGRSDAQITLTGIATDHAANMSSDAKLDGLNLISENTVINLSSDASAVITAKGIVTANVSSDGSLTIYGNPKKVNQTKGSDATIQVMK